LSIEQSIGVPWSAGLWYSKGHLIPGVPEPQHKKGRFMTDHETPPRLVVALDFSDDIMDKIREAAPDFRVERHYPNVPNNIWADTEVLYTLRHFPELQQVPRLRWIQLHYAGIDRAIKQEIVQAEDIEVTTTSGLHSVQIAEYCLAMIFAFNYRLLKMLDLQSRAEWPQNPHDIFRPMPLRGQTLGIAGYGSIGRELARQAQMLGMKVLASKRDLKRTEEVDSYTEPDTGDPTGDIPERIYPSEALISMARECDFLVIATPLTDETRHSVNDQVFKAMKKSAVLINIARGSVVDEKALISALAAGEIAGAALDVFEEEPLPTGSPLWARENVIISPHVAGNTASYHEKAAAIFIENLKRYQNKQPLLNRIDRSAGY
jgi:phosphoglycerate dehydrogenase-like enzyme